MHAQTQPTPEAVHTTATARTMLDDSPPRLVVVGGPGEVLWQHEADENELTPARSDALLIGSGWSRSVRSEWEPEYEFQDNGKLVLVGFVTTVERITG